VTVLAALLVGVPMVAAHAASVRAETHEDLGPDERAIDDAVCADDERAGEWNTAWAVTFSVAAVGSASLAAFAPSEWFSSDTRVGLYLTAGKATVAAVFKLVRPLEIDVRHLCRYSRSTSATTRHALLVKAAENEKRALLPNILGGLLLNSVSLLYLGWARGDWDGAWVSFGVGSAVSVASTLTAPTQSWLLRRRLDSSAHAAAVPMLGPAAAGLTLVAVW
jgi:hypothetical protein